MFASERHRHIVRLVEAMGRVDVPDLAERFDVSEKTIRKDLLILASDHRLIRSSGGAQRIDHARGEATFDGRRRVAAEAKRRIGAAAAALVEDGQTIAFDASTTALEVAVCLREGGGWRQLTVVTNGIRIAEQLAGVSGVTVLTPGGRVRWDAMSLVGPWGDAFFKRIPLHHAFLGAAGLTVDAGMTDRTLDEALIKREMAANASEVTAIVDRSKWGRTALVTFCPMRRVDRIVMDAPAPTDLAAASARAAIALLEAGDGRIIGRTSPTSMGVGIRR